MFCNGGKTDVETKKSDKIFFQQKYFSSEPKTFASFSRVSFVKKHDGNKWRNTKILIKNFKMLVCFSRFAQALFVNFTASIIQRNLPLEATFQGCSEK